MFVIDISFASDSALLTIVRVYKYIIFTYLYLVLSLRLIVLCSIFFVICVKGADVTFVTGCAVAPALC